MIKFNIFILYLILENESLRNEGWLLNWWCCLRIHKKGNNGGEVKFWESTKRKMGETFYKKYKIIGNFILMCYIKINSQCPSKILVINKGCAKSMFKRKLS